jgi:DNA-directed RNA polymerase subunit RPC12/RpoP
MKKNWEYKIKCGTCGTTIPVESLEQEYLDNTYCPTCILELKRKLDSGEINREELERMLKGE